MSQKGRFVPKKTLNISLQSKKYYTSINSILENWHNNELNISDEACKNLLLMNKINNSITLLQVLNAYQTAEQMLLLSKGNNEDISQDLEAVISSAIKIDLNEMINKIKEVSLNQPVKSNNVIVEEDNKHIADKKESNNIAEINESSSESFNELSNESNSEKDIQNEPIHNDKDSNSEFIEEHHDIDDDTDDEFLINAMFN